MRISGLSVHHLSPSDLTARLRDRAGLTLSMGPFKVRLGTPCESLAEQFYALYREFPLAPEGSLADFRVALERCGNIRRWLRPQVHFKIDGGNSPFEPFPSDAALPLFEWGLNWCVGQRSHQFLMLHAAVVERDGRAVVFPAVPGSGKSTLCAALIHRGWRLLSDEFGLVDLKTGRLVPFPRPLALKNESIGVIRRFAPEAVIGPLFPKTRKGTVAHLRPPLSSVQRMSETVRPARIVFPRFKAGASLVLRPVAKPLAFFRLANNSFNYEVAGAEGFRAVGDLTRSCGCHELIFGDLEQAVGRLDELDP